MKVIMKKKGLWTVVLLVLALMLAMVPAVVNQPTAQAIPLPLTPHQEAINGAIERGLNFYRATQGGIEGWPCPEGTWPWADDNYVAAAGMAALAFLEKGISESDPTVSQAIDYILSMQREDGSIWASELKHKTYETCSAIWTLAATNNSEYADEIEAATNFLISRQFDEDYVDEYGNLEPVNESDGRYGGFGYGADQVREWGLETDRPDLSNTQFTLIALRASGLPEDDPAWEKAVKYISRCQDFRSPYQDMPWVYDEDINPVNDGGFVYMTWGNRAEDPPVHPYESYGSMTAAGVWALRLAGVSESDPRVEAGLQWLQTNYAYDVNPGDYAGWLYYYLWSAAKAFLVCDIKGEIGGLVPVAPADDPAFDAGWYYDFSKYLVDTQIILEEDPDIGFWSGWGGPTICTAWALYVLEKAVGIPYAVQVWISPPSVTVKPGETAEFTVAVSNIGTQTDSYDMDVMDLPVTFGWDMEDPVLDVPGRTSRELPLGITPPADLAIWEDTLYSFIVSATSLTDPGISHATTAAVMVQVEDTPASRTRCVNELLDELQAAVEAADIQPGVESSLMEKLDNAEKHKEKGLTYLESGQITNAKNRFNTSINIIEAFVNEVIAQAEKKLSTVDATNFIERAQDIIARLQIIMDSL